MAGKLLYNNQFACCYMQKININYNHHFKSIELSSVIRFNLHLIQMSSTNFVVILYRLDKSSYFNFR